ncbi:hypothetical protein AAFF_G00094960 [Aldrovandia affinis]|uniref:Uncharacterized protein n=1 Tax=Aldrovandia affinis TaxID=143900 RepID=A0AAD7WCT8_9TELE|nr:hypothetical protein AAFF_G00094960 [Aldrovandia affinis]
MGGGGAHSEQQREQKVLDMAEGVGASTETGYSQPPPPHPRNFRRLCRAELLNTQAWPGKEGFFGARESSGIPRRASGGVTGRRP